MVQGETDHEGSNRNHWQAQQHAHRNKRKIEQVGIGLLEKLAENSRDTIAKAEQAGNQARPLEGAGTNGKAENDKDDEPFENGLIDLTRMPRQRTGSGKHHCPRHVGRTPPKLRPNEVRNPAEANADGAARRADIECSQQRGFVVAGENPRRDAGPDHGAAAKPERDATGS